MGQDGLNSTFSISPRNKVSRYNKAMLRLQIEAPSEILLDKASLHD